MKRRHELVPDATRKRPKLLDAEEETARLARERDELRQQLKTMKTRQKQEADEFEARQKAERAPLKAMYREAKRRHVESERRLMELKKGVFQVPFSGLPRDLQLHTLKFLNDSDLFDCRVLGSVYREAFFNQERPKNVERMVALANMGRTFPRVKILSYNAFGDFVYTKPAQLPANRFPTLESIKFLKETTKSSRRKNFDLQDLIGDQPPLTKIKNLCVWHGDSQYVTPAVLPNLEHLDIRDCLQLMPHPNIRTMFIRINLTSPRFYITLSQHVHALRQIRRETFPSLQAVQFDRQWGQGLMAEVERIRGLGITVSISAKAFL